MNRRKYRLFFVILVIGICTPLSIFAQVSGPVVDILGQPDTTSNPPNAQMYVSIVNPQTGRAIDNLNVENFQVSVSGSDVSPTVNGDETGIAVIMVVDRGGIGESSQMQRINWAVDLMEEFIGKLQVDGTSSADMVGLISIREREWESGPLTPTARLTDWDPVSVSNQFNTLRSESINTVTPLFDGLDQAIAWFTDNPDPEVQEKLENKRRVILVFSDGIDNKFSNRSHEAIITTKCTEHKIQIYTIRIGGGSGDVNNMQTLASQTNGRNVAHNGPEDTAASDMFDGILTQRQIYKLTFDLSEPKGNYNVRIQVNDTPVGSGYDETSAVSKLEPPKMMLQPLDTTRFTVVYSKTLTSFLPQTITFKVDITPADNINHPITNVSYYANDNFIGTSADQPNYNLSWVISDLYTPTQQMITEKYTIRAEAVDQFLDTKITTDAPLQISVEWEEKQVDIIEATTEEVKENWWQAIFLVGLLFGLLIVLILLIKTRGQLAKKVVSRTTTALKGMTQRLGVGGGVPATAKLVVIKGPNAGNEYKLTAAKCKVGRDPRSCDFALYDQFTSNPHFSILSEKSQFFIVDEKSTNGTVINGSRLAPGQRYTLPADSLIEAGNVQLQFKRLGGATRRLGNEGMASNINPSDPGQSNGQIGYQGPTQQSPMPSEPPKRR
ncbi:MAG: FHA domain-containing protein [Anaerolineae bacterium]|nr:FHA domain-containing protein [Anaerolineae bacterium]